MEFKQLRNDDSAVSPVIGVILMVAITVILAAVIATFVLGLGDQVSSTSPQATFAFDYEESDGTGELTITHSGGESVDGSELSITGTTSDEVDWDSDEAEGSSGMLSAGSQAIVEVDPGSTVHVVWESSEGGQSATLQTWEGPGA